jgi:tryptophan 7-halogenase
MGFRMDTSRAALDRDPGGVQRAFAQNEALKVKWTRLLPRNRDLINKIKEHGLQRI